MNESQIHKLYIYHIYPRDSKVYSDRGFVKYRRWISRWYSLDLFHSKK